jgi:hypothetical protein
MSRAPGMYVAGARKVCRGHHGARGRRVGQACHKPTLFFQNKESRLKRHKHTPFFLDIIVGHDN